MKRSFSFVIAIILLSIGININGNSYAKYTNVFSEVTTESSYIIDKKRKKKIVKEVENKAIKRACSNSRSKALYDAAAKYYKKTTKSYSNKSKFERILVNEQVLKTSTSSSIIELFEKKRKIFKCKTSYKFTVFEKEEKQIIPKEKVVKKPKKREEKIKSEGYAWTTFLNTESYTEVKNRICKAAKKNSLNNALGKIKIVSNESFTYLVKVLYVNPITEEAGKKSKRFRCYYGAEYTFKISTGTDIAKSEPTKKPEKISNDQAILEEERRKIEEEKRKIEEEKRKIAEAKKKQEEEEKILIIGSGTGFFVNDQGHIITNNHVVEICKMMAAEIDGDPKIFKILATDEQNDLALIKGDYVNKNFLNLSTRGAVFGEDIVAFGYPLDTELSSSVKLTRGIVSSLSGPKNNISQIQIDAAIQPGNSGGPVLNYEGQVVGVASSGLNKWYMIEKSEYIPENVNFAVAAPTLLSFLKANNINFGEKKIEVSKTKELAKIGMPSTIQLLCLNTKSTHEKHKKNKKYSDVLLKQVIELR